VVALLLRANAAIDHCMTNCNATPLVCAAAGGHVGCVEMLIAAGADRSIAMTAAEDDIGGGAGMTALDLAKAKGHGSVADLLGT
jgi:ankyrin repeat protein